MEKIGIFYGTTSGKTEAIADEIDFNLRKYDHEVFNVADGIDEIENFKNLILITPTYGVGELQKDWEDHSSQLKNMDFSGKKVALVGLGNQFTFGESFVEGMRKLYDIVIENHGEVIGFTSNEGYKYQESEAVIGNKFVGLALDETNQDNETPERVSVWIKEILKEFY
ncbi:MAG: flavodoxin [Fusobacterium perfoetens]|uniref:flavodoxin n=1 Tax=Fusobacterium perfoetens TaxID=852 RepID=UPI0023F4965D|nr:flavodoxin [Fusobacterium perfoetens]MCI6152113.1 flavodoxin [Fusobacterium perfoetens]MDY3237996.1 flavodoxin [Fusobacterium perfoetens]